MREGNKSLQFNGNYKNDYVSTPYTPHLNYSNLQTRHLKTKSRGAEMELEIKSWVGCILELVLSEDSYWNLKQSSLIDSHFPK